MFHAKGPSLETRAMHNGHESHKLLSSAKEIELSSRLKELSQPKKRERSEDVAQRNAMPRKSTRNIDYFLQGGKAKKSAPKRELDKGMSQDSFYQRGAVGWFQPKIKKKHKESV